VRAAPLLPSAVSRLRSRLLGGSRRRSIFVLSVSLDGERLYRLVLLFALEVRDVRSRERLLRRLRRELLRVVLLPLLLFLLRLRLGPECDRDLERD